MTFVERLEILTAVYPTHGHLVTEFATDHEVEETTCWVGLNSVLLFEKGWRSGVLIIIAKTNCDVINRSRVVGTARDMI